MRRRIQSVMNLPYDAEVEYIYPKEGSPLVKLPAVGASDETEFIIDVELGTVSGCNLYYVRWGSWVSEADNFLFTTYSNVYLDYGSGYGYNRIFYSGSYLGKRFKFHCGNRYIKDLITGVTLSSGNNVSFTNKTRNGVWNVDLGSYVSGKGSKLRSFYLRDDYNGTLYDLIPVRKKVDGIDTGFMYDKISGKLFGPSSTSAVFGFGPDV